MSSVVPLGLRKLRVGLGVRLGVHARLVLGVRHAVRRHKEQSAWTTPLVGIENQLMVLSVCGVCGH